MLKKKILIVDNHSKRMKELTRLVAGHDVSVCDCDNFTSKKAENFDLIILSGGSHVYSADNTKKAYTAEIDFIRETMKPVIGICLGCQLIAKAFGGTLEKMKEKSRGILEINFAGKSYSVFESHKYTIKSLPSCINVIAESETGSEIIQHESKPIYGFQFHPEAYPRKTAGKKLFRFILKEVL